MAHDLGHYLGAEFRGEQLDRYVLPKPKPRMPLYHLVGARPALPTDVEERIGDGLPETLAEWIRFNGLTHLKIKLNGDDLDWDVDRAVASTAWRNRKSAAGRAGGTRSTSTSDARTSATCSSSCAGEGEDAGRLRPHPVHRAADGARPEGEPRERHARGARSCARW